MSNESLWLDFATSFGVIFAILLFMGICAIVLLILHRVGGKSTGKNTPRAQIFSTKSSGGLYATNALPGGSTAILIENDDDMAASIDMTSALQQARSFEDVCEPVS